MSAPLWSLERGASPLADGTVRFRLWAPKASRVDLRIMNGDPPRTVPLEASGEGLFEATVPGGAGLEYFYRLEGSRDRPDPVSRSQPRGVHGPSRVEDPSAFTWTDGGWRGLDMADLVIYELHVGAFTAEGTFDAAARRLPELRSLGVTAVELMPVAAFPGTRNWGYDGVHPYAPQPSYGGPEGLKRLIDAAHGIGLAVILDVVYNHLGPEGNYLAEFGPYFTERYRTPWGKAINFDDSDSDEVRRYFRDNALYWVTEFHFDGLRLDAVHGIYDFTARHILGEIASAVHEQAGRLGRRAHVIAESDLNDPRLVRDPAQGGFGLDGQWSDDFHHAVHCLLTSEREGYYADFGGAEPVARALRNRFVYDGRPSSYRRRRHGAPADDVPAERFVVFVQNHDQVGNRARGERLSTLVSPATLRLAAAFLLLSPYVPLLFMGEEYGETRPFLYFVSHGAPGLVEAVREGRRAEFAAFGWQGEVPDPQAEETFAASRLDRSVAERPANAAILSLYRDLLRLRRDEPALRPGSAGIEAYDGATWVALHLSHPQRSLLAAFNAAESATTARVPNPEEWQPLLTTDDARYGGSGIEPEALRPTPEGVEIFLPPRTAVLYREARTHG